MLPGSMGQGSRKRKEKIKGLRVLQWERECERRGNQRWKVKEENKKGSVSWKDKRKMVKEGKEEK